MSSESYRDIPRLSEDEEEYEGDYDYEEEPEISDDISEEDEMNQAKFEERTREPVEPIK